MTQNSSITPNSLILLCSQLFPAPASGIMYLFSVSIILPDQNVISWNHSICNLLSVAFFFFLREMHLRLSHVFMWISSSFFHIADWYSLVWLHYNLFIHSQVEGHLSYFDFGDYELSCYKRLYANFNMNMVFIFLR